METRAQLGAVPRVLIAMAMFALLTVLTAGAIAIGSGITSSSPNGLIAYKDLSGDIWTAGPDGDHPQLLIEAAGRDLSGPAWSPDGTRLAFWSTADGVTDLVVTTAQGSDPVVVASDVESTSWQAADWSPDGTQLTFTALTPAADSAACLAVGGFCGSRVFVADADGSTGAVQIGDPDLDAREAAWSPDGTSIAFGAGHPEAEILLYVMGRDGSDVRQLSDLVGDGFALYKLDWSPDGRFVVGTSGRPTWDIWAFPIDGSEPMNLSGPAIAAGQTIDRLFPAYAADGAIAWAGGWGQEPCECVTWRDDDTDPVLLDGFSGAPTWSPDGRFLIAQEDGGNRAFAIIDREGQLHGMITNVGDGDPSWQRVGG
jgi:Tol biopolymer transport system component